MAEYTFKMPDIGEGVVEGEVVAWHVKPGDDVREDQPLVDIMTDKATVTIPSTVHGKIVRTQGKPGEMVAVGRELIVFEMDQSAVPAPAAHAAGTQPKSTNGPAAPIAPPVAQAATASSSAPPGPARRPGERPLASPAVRRLAKERGVDLAGVPGGGPAGRIRREDLDAALNAASSPAFASRRAKRSGTRELPMIGLRRKIAEKMTISKRHIPHFSFFDEIDVTHLDDLKDHLNAKFSGERVKLTYLPFVLQALVKALTDHPECNAHYHEERTTIVRHEAIHIGIAAQTSRGLLVPVVHNVESLDLWETATQLRKVIQATRENTAKLDDLTGSTFTVTSLGSLGGLGATPIINHPEVGIIGLHRAEDRPVCRRGRIVVRKMMNISSSFDHRVVDGADAAGMVQTLKTYLENPATIFI